MKEKHKLLPVDTEALLGQYFTVEDKTVTADLYFDTFAELVDPDFGDDRVEKLNGTLFEKLDEIFALVPRKYGIHVHVHIRDFGDYTLSEAESIVRRNIALKIYALALESRRKHLTGLGLLASGVAMLLLSYFLGDKGPQILFDVINISGTLFVWEAADITLIERSEDAKRAKQYIRKFKDVRLMQAEPSDKE